MKRYEFLGIWGRALRSSSRYLQACKETNVELPAFTNHEHSTGKEVEAFQWKTSLLLTKKKKKKKKKKKGGGKGREKKKERKKEEK